MNRWVNQLRFAGIAALVVALGGTAPGQEPAIDFARDVAPVLQQHCGKCHGDKEPEGGLRLTSRKNALLRSDSGQPAFVPKESGKSELIRRVSATLESGERMPPEGEPLSQEQIDLLRRWIDAGAEWPESATGPKHWAYVKPVRPALPEVHDTAWSRNEIDRFVLARLEAEGLSPSPAADPAKLIRRVYLDLIGLPPTVEQVDAFLSDPTPARYEQIVDELLRSPRYGEKWARQWLDLARYADTNGYQADQFRELWAYRDWVINAMNDDLPYDRFTIEQIAGDLLPGATIEQKIATGFHRCTTCNVEAGVDAEENRVNQIIDRVNTTGTVWLGTTLECAQCHNHKYDPFSQQDYYQLFAFFNNTPLEVNRPEQDGVQYEVAGPTLPLPLDPEQQARFDELSARQRPLQSQIEARKQALADLQPAWEAQMADGLKAAPQWHVLTDGQFHATGGATSRTLDDGSLLVTGALPERDTYTVTFTTRLAGITGFKLECLTDDSLPSQGPGRAGGNRPNVVIQAFEVTAAPADGATQGAPVALHSATADFSQQNWDVAGLIDNDPKSGWAIAPQFGKDHWASFLTAQPIAFEGGVRLTFTISQNYGGSRTIGRLRLSAMTGTPGTDAVPAAVREALAVAPGKRNRRQKTQVANFHAQQDAELKALEKQLADIGAEIQAIQPVTTMVMVEMGETRMTRIFKRGDFLQPTATVDPCTPAVLPPLDEQPGDRERPTRLSLAEWLVSPENPLTPRVAVNRWWSEFFGQGIVGTLEDFGVQGDAPTHPELLDWLAVEFVEGGWSMKRLHKRIVMSATYQQDSRVTPKLLRVDPYNTLYARGPRFRLTAETIRDNALAISGLLSSKMGGPPVYPPQPPNIWRHVGRNEPKYATDTDEDRFRRGVYVVWRRSAPYPSFVNFDAPDRGSCVVNRSRTNTPLQALTLLNDPAYVEMAGALAKRIVSEAPSADDRTRAEYAFRLAVSRQPSSDEAEALLRVLEDGRQRMRDDPKAATSLVPDKTLDEVARQELATWYYVANVLLNLDETVTKN
jgi:hypothetical protein